ncbi:sugar phosphate nucleotidyltransferase [uncultured Sphaerochaeta sp.]|uniref:nucleotidyltransferase family protein n=1 Tax=uncultured Sphaerochaeta sp. TaxID=886478 RepID=UPI002A0A5E37|nr:sugar phosphate nucleotidyltransferase [uncultured Sphaerochaeta sp.]
MKPTLVVLAAGMGSRYGGVKQIDSVGAHGETLLDFGVYDAMKSGFSKVVFIIRKDIETDFRERLFDRIAKNMNAEYVFQGKDTLLSKEQVKLAANREKPWGTIHAVLCAKDVVKEPFAVINADDYYGREAFSILSKHLGSVTKGSVEHAMVGYVLDHTMSKSGSVSRAICTVKDNYLVSMRENTKIEYVADKVISHIDGQDVELTGKEWVSMNFFGFTPAAFDSFGTYWEEFLKDNITAAKTECFLPNGASRIVTNHEGKIRFYTTQESWFGMTYSADRQLVHDELAKKTEQGYYPEKLWSN